MLCSVSQLLRKLKIGPHCQFIARWIKEVETPSARKRKNIPGNRPLTSKKSFTSSLEVCCVNNRQRVLGAMVGISIDSAAQTTALRIGIIISPIFIGPTEYVHIKDLRQMEVFRAFYRELYEVKGIFSIFYGHYSFVSQGRNPVYCFWMDQISAYPGMTH